MVRAITAILLAMLLVPAYADNQVISVGGVATNIPTPVGLAIVTPAMRRLSAVLQHRVPPGSTYLAGFIPEDTVSMVLLGKIHEVTRHCVIESIDSLAHLNISDAQFAYMEEIATKRNNEIVERVAKRFPEIVSEVNAELTKKHDADIIAIPTDSIVLPIHYKTKRAFAYSVYVAFQEADNNGKREAVVRTSTTTVVHAHNKVVQLLCAGGKADLAWTRKESQTWADAVVAANQR